MFGSGQPRAAAEPGTAESFDVGDKVEHRTFGPGKVTEVKGDRVTIRFKGEVGTKTLLVGFAPLRKL